jgi:hypothetical protein
MAYRFLTAFTLSVTTLFGVSTTGGDASEASTKTVHVSIFDTFPIVSKQSVFNKDEALLQQQIQQKAAGVKFWEAVSWCETNHDWKNSGYYAGGLGIAQSTWKGYGGWEFAKTPRKATKTQQIIVANRIGFLGYQTTNEYITLVDKLNNKPFFRPYSRNKSWGRGCANWKTRKPHRVQYTEQD